MRAKSAASVGLVAGQRLGMTRFKFDFPGVSRMLISANINTREKRWQFVIAGTSTCQAVVAQYLQAGRHLPQDRRNQHGVLNVQLKLTWLATTTVYVTTEGKRRMKVIAAYWQR